MRFAESVSFVDQHLADILGEVVAQRPGDRIAFAEDQAGARQFEHRLDDFVPLHLQVVEVPLQLGRRAANARGAHDRAHAIGDDQLIHDLLHLIAIFAFDTPRDATGARVVGHQHQEPAGQADEGRQRRAFIAALFLLHLYDDVLAFAQ